MMQRYYASGKLLISGEYTILRGARGLALPTLRGQELKVEHLPEQDALLRWESLDERAQTWFEAEFDLPLFTLRQASDAHIASRLQQLLLMARNQNPDFLQSEGSGYKAQSQIQFPRDWGLGSSSTLIHTVAQWAQVDAFALARASFGGSGYDVMVAEHACPILFQKVGEKAQVEELQFNPDFSDRIAFVHLGEKADTAKAIKAFDVASISADLVQEITNITESLVQADESTFCEALRQHDAILSKILNRPSAQEQFPEFSGYLKYLGAWGGDFMMAVSSEEERKIFSELGYSTVLSYQDMIAQ